MNGPGFSFFLGPAWTDASLATYIDEAAGAGFREAFVSLFFIDSYFITAQYPALTSGIVSRLAVLTRHAAGRGIAVTIDVAPHILDALGAGADRLSALARLGVRRIRADYGFSLADLARLSRAAGTDGMTVVLNASHPGWKAGLARLSDAGADFAALSACHNYYPRPETGLASTFAAACSRPFLEQGMAVGAFVPSSSRRLPPLGEGLPSLEAHRCAGPVGDRALTLLQDGVATAPFLGDMGSAEELRALHGAWESWQRDGGQPAVVTAAEGPAPDAGPAGEAVAIRVRVGDGERQNLTPLWGQVLTNRWDRPELLLRASGLRGRLSVTPQGRPAPRRAFSVTVDNALYPRYSGEVHVPLVDLPADRRVNVVGEVVEADRAIARALGPGANFRLIPLDCER
ncbi:MAG: MupG family TIM beta-alpha barrel fold protein [Symbiobacteriia bacterium]